MGSAENMFLRFPFLLFFQEGIPFFSREYLCVIKRISLSFQENTSAFSR